MVKKKMFTSFRDASILRKFSVFFLLITIIPISFFFFVYLKIDDAGTLQLTKDSIHMAFIWVMLGVGLGYWLMRALLKSIISMAQKNTMALSDVIGSEKVSELTKASDDEIAVLARTFNEVTTRLEENVKSLQLAQKTLHSVLARVGKGLSSYDDIDDLLNLIIETVADALLAKRGFLLMFDEGTNTFRLKSHFGMEENVVSKYIFKPSEVVFGQVLSTKAPFILQGLDVDDDQVSQSIFEFPLVCSPLIVRDKVIGVMVVCGRQIEGGFFKEEMNLLHNLSLQTAVAVENDRLNASAEQTYFDTISALALAVEARDPYARGHSDRVAQYCVQLAQHFNLEQDDIYNLRDAAKIHDLGKIGITDDILDKPGPLTDDEWVMMRKHPEIGESIIKPIKSLRPLCDIVRHHHEKLNGSGYPDKLKGNEISLLVRILVVADIFDALTTDRSYRKAMSVPDTLKMMRQMDDKIDQRVVDALEEIVQENSIPT